METQKFYLELSQDAGSSHKFYEVTVANTTMSIRYGRIGTDGTTSTKVFASYEDALKEAKKKVRGKKSKGYEEAVIGVRKKRAISRRAITSTRSSSKGAPLLWKFNSKSSAFGIYISDEYCWIGNEAGSVYRLTHEGEVVSQYQLPDGVKCIIADGDWIYVGCDDGNVYDLTGKMPRIAYEIKEDVDIYWLDINNGLLGVSDAGGGITVINAEDEEQWSKKSAGTHGWMVRCDEVGRVYHGHSEGLSCYYGWEGKHLWDQKTKGAVLFGWRMQETVLAGTSRNWMELFDKEGKKLGEMKGDTSIYSCATSENNEFIFGGDSSSSIYCFDNQGNRLWKLGTTCGSAYSMQYHKGKLYIVTTDGSLACIDAGEEAIEKAKQGEVAAYVDIKAPAKVAVADSQKLDPAPANATGVELICIQEGSNLRVRVTSPGYHSDWNVQFPKNLRKLGAKYLVDSVREAGQGSFYRVFGNIYGLG